MTTIRTDVNTKTMEEILIDLENIATDIYATGDEPNRLFGDQTEGVKLKNVALAVNLQHSMASEIEGLGER